MNSHKHKLISKLRSCIIVMRAFFGKALVSYLLKISVDERNVKNGIRAILLNLPNPIPKISGLNSIFPFHYITTHTILRRIQAIFLTNNLWVIIITTIILDTETEYVNNAVFWH